MALSCKSYKELLYELGKEDGFLGHRLGPETLAETMTFLLSEVFFWTSVTLADKTKSLCRGTQRYRRFSGKCLEMRVWEVAARRVTL